MSLAENLTNAIAQVAPIHGVAIRRRDDRSTWVIDFKEGVTDAERAAASEALAAYDPDAEELKAVRAAKWAARTARRKLAEETFSFGGIVLRLDEGTQMRLGLALQGMELTGDPAVEWEIAPGVTQIIPRGQLVALATAAFRHVQACFRNSRVVGELIARAQTLEEIEAIDVEAGWPK